MVHAFSPLTFLPFFNRGIQHFEHIDHAALGEQAAFGTAYRLLYKHILIG